MGKTYKDFGKVMTGYSEDFTPNESWEEQGLLCEWEHCIDNMYRPEFFFNKDVCPVFGRTCPGGVKQADRCKKIATELWHKIDERFK